MSARVTSSIGISSFLASSSAEERPIVMQRAPYGTFDQAGRSAAQVDPEAFRLLREQDELLRQMLMEQKQQNQQSTSEKLTFSEIEYEGQVKDGKPHGVGKLTFNSGAVYVGMFDNGAAQGKGVLKYSDGDQYEGDFDNNNQHGQGVYRWNNGMVYLGTWVKDKGHGQCIVRFEDGATFEGTYRNGKMYKGKKTCADGTIYDGEWKDDSFYSGTCTFFANGGLHTQTWTKGSRVRDINYWTAAFFAVINKRNSA